MHRRVLLPMAWHCVDKPTQRPFEQSQHAASVQVLPALNRPQVVEQLADI